jgi:cbb3-type cytochrome oxidase cytochrome c subunit
MNKPALIAIIAAAAVVTIFLINGLQSPDGAALFRKEGCINCHSFKGQGGETGPDLTAVTQRRSNSWIRAQIRNPRSHNPASQMPSFTNLSGREIGAIIKYLNS